ncbi:hypothetical protein VB776_16380 [Arcicella sp. DC2W]|uniref:Uncharacterized protein n=1 Tax=Arcicella gelida TaxID=2984195 RepID=A0ABU5S7S0_9BACT|nr:hypothetical protein [Arcicella sp. DC2W]MEA5404511.1 hypothetical protein [Arcicella sp. DC2W]
MKRYTLIDQSEVSIRESGIYSMFGTSQTASTWTLPSRYSTNSKARETLILLSNVSSQCIITLNTRGGEQFRLKGVTSNSITIRPQQECLLWNDGTYWIPSFWKNEIEVSTSSFDPASVASNATVSSTVTVSGASLGDFVLTSFSLNIAGLILQSYVSSANTVTVTFINLTVSTIDLSAGTLKIKIIK